MLISDWINIICAILALIATIIIGGIQIRQDKRVKKLTERQINKEQADHIEQVEIEARKFLLKYNNCIRLLPLCAIAYAYNPNRPYHREMYSEFRLLSKEVRLKIFEYNSLKMCDIESDNFFEDCLKSVKHAAKQFYPEDNFDDIFYDTGKWFQNAIENYAHLEIPQSDFEKITKNCFKAKSFNNIKGMFRASNISDKEAAAIICKTAQCIGIFANNYGDDEESKIIDIYGCPDECSGVEIETMEDLFLLALFTIWAYLIDFNQIEKLEVNQ